MITIIDGDLLSSNADIIAHQVNCQGKMNSGVAKQIREKYPDVYNVYMKWCEMCVKYKDVLLGRCQLVKTRNGKLIANLFGQLGYGYDGKQYTDLNALKNAMINLRDYHIRYMDKATVVAMPYKIGCARGGANWDDVYKIIDEIFKDYTVELWRLDKG